MDYLHIPREQKLMLVDRMAAYLEQEHGLQLGSLGAEAAFDELLRIVSPIVHNQALADARRLVAERAAQLEDDLYALEKPVRLTDR